MESWDLTYLHLGDKSFAENENGGAGSRNLTEVLSGSYVIIGVVIYRRELKCGLRDKISHMLSHMLRMFRLNPT